VVVDVARAAPRLGITPCMTAGPFATLPPRTEVANLALLTLAFAAWFALCYGAGSALPAYLPWRAQVALPMDAQIPFWPGAAALYLSITPMLLLAPMVLRDLRALLPLFAALMLETTVAALFFVSMPIDDTGASCVESTLGCALFRIADTINLQHNNLPSLHVAFACTLALAYSPRASQLGGALLYVWVLAVALSTLLTHQHYVLDVVAGMLLALVCWRVAGSWARRPRVIAAFDVELLCLRNFALFSRRHRRYFFQVLALLAVSLPRWRHHRLARSGFAFLQALDDIMDGDRRYPAPLELGEELLLSLGSGRFADHDLARLGAAFREDLLARGGDAALQTARDLVRTLLRDRRRVMSREVSSRETLAAYHRDTFNGSLDLMLLAAGSALRARDVPLLVDALGWCSTVRDLPDDLAHGLINIPADVFESAAQERRGVRLPDLIDSGAVQRWLSGENTRAITLLDGVDAQIAGLGDRRGAGLLRRFARSMRKYTTAAPAPATQVVSRRA
jgi:membrane-associated phospholipid phosphatase